ncbi:MAG: metalloregulator ArsR/SmtB family transcription factor [Planctomycetota bacterium]
MRNYASTAPATDAQVDRLRRIGKALADPTRLRILAALDGRELCVCHLVDVLDRSASTVSRHVTVLRDARLVAVRKEGRWLHCRRANPDETIWKAIDELMDGSEALTVEPVDTSAPCCG